MIFAAALLVTAPSPDAANCHGLALRVKAQVVPEASVLGLQERCERVPAYRRCLLEAQTREDLTDDPDCNPHAPTDRRKETEPSLARRHVACDQRCAGQPDKTACHARCMIDTGAQAVTAPIPVHHRKAQSTRAKLATQATAACLHAASVCPKVDHARCEADDRRLGSPLTTKLLTAASCTDIPQSMRKP